MKTKSAKKGSYDVAEETFNLIDSLLADARGNALMMSDPQRFVFASGYLQLAARKATALSELVGAVAHLDRTRGDSATRKLAEIDKDIEKHLKSIAVYETELLRKAGAADFLEQVKQLNKCAQAASTRKADTGRRIKKPQ